MKGVQILRYMYMKIGGNLTLDVWRYLGTLKFRVLE